MLQEMFMPCQGIHVRSIAFPLISTGGFGYPKEEGMRIAVDEITAFLMDNPMEIYLVVFDEKARSIGKNIYPNLEDYIDKNYVDDKTEAEYGEGFFKAADDNVSANCMLTSDQMIARRRQKSREETESLSRIMAGKPSAIHKDDSIFKSRNIVPRDDAPMESVLESESIGAVPDFETKHESKLNERINHISDTFSQYLMYLIKRKNMENAEVYKWAIVDKKIFSKIKNNVDYHPQKMTALCLCIGAKLNLDESKDLLARARYALSPCSKTDIIFSYFIENEIYDMIELDIQLEAHGIPCMIS